jgi:hypothetical protein
MEDRTVQTIIVILIALCLLWYFKNWWYEEPVLEKSSLSKLHLLAVMDRLWAEHVMWTRMYIMASLDNAANKELIAGRLLKNQEDIGGAVGMLYGKPAGDKLTALLKEHILIAVKIVDALKSSNKKALSSAKKLWYKNAIQIATFLSSANPYLKLDDMKKMMLDHLRLTTKELVALQSHDWTADIAAYDAVVKQAMMMSQGLTDAISKHIKLE